MMINFLENEVFSIIVAITCVIILYIILNKQSLKIVKKLLFGIINGFLISSVLYYVFNMSLEIISVVGLIIFMLTIFLSKAN